MSDFVLHHYPMSPFAQKIRSMLGYADIPWHSALTREMPPRPQLARLAGGYRKIPVAQIGADIFCDSRIIASEIAVLANKPALALENCNAEVQGFVKRTDLDMFFACLMSAQSKTLRNKMWNSMSLPDIARFFWDRINIGRTASVKMAGPKQAPAMVQFHLEMLERMLATQDFLFGDEPCHADFSAYHSLWFIRDLAERNTIAPFAKVDAWMDRIKAFGEGRPTPISIEIALDHARAATPRPIAAEDAADPLIGSKVKIGPADYGKDQTAGILVGSSASRWIVARDAEGIGCVHVHFPKQGFALAVIG